MGERTRGTRKANQLDTLRTSWLAKGTLIQRLREFVWVGGCVTTPATWASPPGQRRRSVHRLAKMASRCRSGALVYTVATRGSRELRCEPRRVARVLQSPWRAGGVPSVAASRLVGKTDPAPVAPPLAWRLRRDVNPHEPPKGFFQCKRTIGGDGHAGYR